jgi:hypothetical protein
MRDCKSIPDPAPRLACYDKIFPPLTPANKSPDSAAKGSGMAKVSDSKTSAGKYVDPIGAEDALMNAQLKNICRGC